MTCLSCSAPNDDAARFCARCGAPLEAAAPAAAALPETAVPPAPVARKSKVVPVLATVLASVVLLVVVFFAWAALSPSTPPADATPTPEDGATATPGSDLSAATSPDEAVRLVAAKTGRPESDFEFSMDLLCVDNGDGTLTPDVTENLGGTVACYVVAPRGEAGGDFSVAYVAQKDTEWVFQLPSADSGVLVRIGEDAPASTEAAPTDAPDDGSRQAALQTVANNMSLSDTSGLRFVREEYLIDNGDGTLSFAADAPDKATLRCYLICGKDIAEPALSDFYVVPVGTDGSYMLDDVAGNILHYVFRNGDG